MSKYVVMVDWKAEYKSGFDYWEMTAKDAIEAIEQADTIWNNCMYLVKILEKTGKAEKAGADRVVTYKSVLCRRSFGWHRTNAANGETETIVKQYTNKYGTSYEILL